MPLQLQQTPGLVGIHMFLQAAAIEGATNFVISNAVEGQIGGR